MGTITIAPYVPGDPAGCTVSTSASSSSKALLKYMSGSITPGSQEEPIFNIPELLSAAVAKLKSKEPDPEHILGKGKEKVDADEILNPDTIAGEKTALIPGNKALFSQRFPLGKLFVQRFGINPEAFEEGMEYAIASNELHPAEEVLFLVALAELADKPSAEYFVKNRPAEYADNAVVVDIFARTDNGTQIRKEGKTGYPEVHSVVLWKKKKTEGKDQIVLIDPSKVDFSEHIRVALQSKKYVGDHVKVIKANFPGPKNVLYGKGKCDTGPSDYKVSLPLARDCIDIAAKICAELNEQQKEVESIEPIEINTFTKLTNQSRINKQLGQKLDGTVMREPQGSLVKDRKEAASFFEKHDNFSHLRKPVTLEKLIASLPEITPIKEELQQLIIEDKKPLKLLSFSLIQQIAKLASPPASTKKD